MLHAAIESVDVAWGMRLRHEAGVEPDVWQTKCYFTSTRCYIVTSNHYIMTEVCGVTLC